MREGINIIRDYEGCRLKAYRCPAGVLTIGYGRTTGVKAGQKVTQTLADAWLLAEYDEFEAVVLKMTDGTANQIGALTSFAYNVGVAALKSSTLLKLHKAKDFRGAAAQFARWNKVGGKVLVGLTRRRAAEAALYTA